MKWFTYSDIGTFRSELMGIAIIWIFLFHSYVSFPGNLYFLNAFKSTGYGGVDIFMFLSGLGLYFSYKKNNALLSFYKNRALRILPVYWSIIIAVGCIRWFLNKITLKTVLIQLTTIGFWLNKDCFDWFIPSLIALYLIFPVFARFFIGKHWGRAIIAAVAVGLVFSICIQPSSMNYLLIFSTRIPVFFIGAYYGYLIESRRPFTSNDLLLHIFFLFAGSVSLILVFRFFSSTERSYYGLWWYSFIFITPALCLFLPKVFELLLKTGLPRFLRFCGKHSLEIYLVFRQILPYLGNRMQKFFSFDKTRIVEQTVDFLIILALAYCIRRAIDFALHAVSIQVGDHGIRKIMDNKPDRSVS